MQTLYLFRITHEKHGEGGSFLYLLIYLSGAKGLFYLPRVSSWQELTWQVLGLGKFHRGKLEKAKSMMWSAS